MMDPKTTYEMAETLQRARLLYPNRLQVPNFPPPPSITNNRGEAAEAAPLPPAGGGQQGQQRQQRPRYDRQGVQAAAGRNAITVDTVRSAIFGIRRDIAEQFYRDELRKIDHPSSKIMDGYHNRVFPAQNVRKLADAFCANPRDFAKLDPEDLDQVFLQAKRDLTDVGFKNQRLDFPNGFGHRIVQRLRKRFLGRRDLPAGAKVP